MCRKCVGGWRQGWKKKGAVARYALAAVALDLLIAEPEIHCYESSASILIISASGRYSNSGDRTGHQACVHGAKNATWH